MITSASILRTDIQKDGRLFVTESQVDDTLGQQLFLYLADVGADLNAIMAARTASINAGLTAVPSATVTADDGATATVRWSGGAVNLQLTAGQKTALQTAKTVIDTVRPFVALYQTLTPVQQQWVLTHSPWFSQVLAVIIGS